MTYKITDDNPTLKRRTTSTRLCPPITTAEQSFANAARRYRASTGGNSPRINGKLQLRTNEHTFRSIRTHFMPSGVSYSYYTTDPCNRGTGKFWIYAFVGFNPEIVKLQPGLPTKTSDESYIKASQAFYSDLNAIKVNVAVAFKERQKTVDLIADSVYKIASLYRSLRRGRNPFNGKKSRSKDAANLWLQYSYGWVPLVNDVYGAIDALQGEVPKVYHKITRQFTEKGEYSTSGSEYIYDCVHDASIDVSRQLKTTVKAVVTVSNPGLAFSSSLGLTNPALVAWEVVPYSFVVDWFYPIGNWLEAQTATLGLSFADASVTRTCRYVANFSKTTKVRPTSSRNTFGCQGNARGQWIQKDKSRTLGIPIITPPRLQSPMTVSHALSALALLRQVFR